MPFVRSTTIGYPTAARGTHARGGDSDRSGEGKVAADGTGSGRIGIRIGTCPITHMYIYYFMCLFLFVGVSHQQGRAQSQTHIQIV